MPEKTDSRPRIRNLTRREFLAISAAAAGGAALGGSAVIAGARDGVPTGDESRRITLPAEPSQNPAFMARAAGDGGLLLWSPGEGGRFRGFRLNAAGRTLWRLCDGSRAAEAVANEFARRSGRPAGDGAAFLKRLLQLGVVVSGASVVPAPGFPAPPPGGCYHRRIEPDDPAST